MATVSIIIPIYNVEKYIESCLKSVINQSYHDYEVICINDCTQDYSMEIVNKYQKKHENIFILNNERNLGLSSSRNVGLQNAKGKYIWFIDSDDYIQKDALKKLVAKAEETESDIVYFNKKIRYEDELKKEKYNSFQYDDIGVKTGREMFTKFMQDGTFKSINAYTQFFRRNFIIENNLKFYDGAVHEDYLFFFQAAMKAKRTSNMNECLYIYRKRRGSITSNPKDENVYSIFLVLIEIWNYWKNNDFSNEENRAISFFFECVYSNLINYKNRMIANVEMPIGEYSDRYIFDRLINFYHINISSKEMLKIKKAKKIWIYGAGNVGKETGIFLERNHIEIEGFLVSKKGNVNKLYGWPIYSIEEKKIEKEDIIIIAVVPGTQRQIKSLLKKKGISNYIFSTKKEDYLDAGYKIVR